MDIKSKSSKKFSFMTAGILIALSVIIFMMLYPVYEKRAAGFFTDRLYSDNFLQKIYQSNFVLYKDLRDKIDQTNYNYTDLFLEIEDNKISQSEADAYSEDFWDEAGIEEIKRILKNEFSDFMQIWRTEIMDGLAKEIDYCIIDNQTGGLLKNTGRNIERLLDGEWGEEQDPYVYYLKMTYDSAGNVKDISVRGTNPDDLLKNVQSVMRSNWIDNRFSSQMQNRFYYSHKLHAFYTDGVPGEVSYQFKKAPRDITVLYALTANQMENISTGGDDEGFVRQYRMMEEMAYYSAGAMNALSILLLALAAAALLLTKSRKYCLHRLESFHMHLEVSLFALFLLFSGFSQSVIGLMNYTNGGYFDEFYIRYFAYLPIPLYSAVTLLINVLFLSIFFGAWYYFVTALGEVFELGFKGFLKERSLFIRLCLWISEKLKKWKNSIKQELLHTDLNTETGRTLKKMVAVNFFILFVISFLWIFSWIFLIFYSLVVYICIKKYIHKIREQYQKLLAATQSIANGNLDTRLEEDWGVFESYKGELNTIQQGFRKAVDEEVKSQKMKTELITNVSHDLKTPLTAITTYIELLKEEDITEEQRKEYIAVLEKKSGRLKFLIEDLFEVSKASSGNVTMNMVDVDICNLIRQVYLEYEDRVEEADLIFRFRLPEEKIILKLDSQKTYRIFENLYTNIIKYAMPHTRVYINGEKTEGGFLVELKNMSSTELNVNPDELTERFVRGDSSRNTEGSGLGLAIAKSFTELQGGRMKVEIDGDLFKAILEW